MNDDDCALVELDVLAGTGPLHATPAALGITWPCVAGPVDAPIRFGAVQRVRRGVDIVNDRRILELSTGYHWHLACAMQATCF